MVLNYMLAAFVILKAKYYLGIEFKYCEQIKYISTVLNLPIATKINNCPPIEDKWPINCLIYTKYNIGKLSEISMWYSKFH